MPLTTLALVLASAFLHAAWNAVLKQDAAPRAAAVAVLAVAVAASVVSAPLFPGTAFPAAAGLAWTVGAGAFEAAYFFTLALALQRAPLGLAYAVARGGALFLVWPASALWLGERIRPASAAGAGLVCAGLALAAHEGRRAAALRGLGWAALCAAAIAGYHLCYKQALNSSAQPAATAALAIALALPPNLFVLGRGGARAVAGRLRARPLALTGAGIACAASFLLFLGALGSSGAGVVATLRNTSVLFAQLLSRAIGERPGRPQIAGAALIVAGAVLLGWPGRS